jgi:hypothetical protein
VTSLIGGYSSSVDSMVAFPGLDEGKAFCCGACGPVRQHSHDFSAGTEFSTAGYKGKVEYQGLFCGGG